MKSPIKANSNSSKKTAFQVNSPPMEDIKETNTKLPIQKIEEIHEETKKKRGSFKEVLVALEEEEEEEDLLFRDPSPFGANGPSPLEDEEENTSPFEGPVDAPIVYSSPFTPHTGNFIVVTKPLPPSLEQFKEMLLEPIQTLSKGGVSQTTLTIQTKQLGSIEVSIDHYDTAPHSFNIFLHTDQILSLEFEKAKKNLEISLKKALPSFECTLYTGISSRSALPSLSRKSKNPLVKSKDLSYSADNDGDDEDE